MQLRLSLEDSRSLAGQLQRDVSRVECRMRSQLQTLMGMSAELRGIADGEARLSVGRRSSASRRSSEEGQPKPSTLWLQEWQTAVQQQKNLASESEDWKLPTILEDKTYPRRTLK